MSSKGGLDSSMGKVMPYGRYFTRKARTFFDGDREKARRESSRTIVPLSSPDGMGSRIFIPSPQTWSLQSISVEPRAVRIANPVLRQ